MGPVGPAAAGKDGVADGVAAVSWNDGVDAQG